MRLTSRGSSRIKTFTVPISRPQHWGDLPDHKASEAKPVAVDIEQQPTEEFHLRAPAFLKRRCINKTGPGVAEYMKMAMGGGELAALSAADAGTCVDRRRPMGVRVLLVSLQGVLGGAETSLCQLVQHLHSRCSIHVACPPDGTLAESLGKLDVPVHPLPPPPPRSYTSPRSAGYWVRVSASAIRIARAVRPHIIHGNTFHTAPAVAVAARLTGAKLLLHARDYPSGRMVTRVCGYTCRRIIAVSDSVKQALVERGLPAEKIQVVYNGVEAAGATADSPHAGSCHRSDRQSQPFAFAHVGQFVEWKRQIDFLQAAAAAAGDLPNARFLLVGDDIFGRNSEYRHRLLHYVETSPIAERITLLGWQNDMARVWPQIDCLVHTADREPFGRVVIEAMLHGIPVIATDRGGPGEILEHGRTGLLVPPQDMHRLATAMVRIASDPGYAAALAAGGRQSVLSRFRASGTAERVHHIYEILMTEHGHAHRAESSCGRPEYLGC
jgi:glycosyltransferase involved in cell wall biosynthesis